MVKACMHKAKTFMDYLACPICQQPLQAIERRYVCAQNHSFDLARQGYLNLLPVQHKKSRQPGDSQAMVAARQRFLQQGHYQPIASWLLQQLSPQLPNQSLRLLDAGCGEGYYLDFLQRQLQQQRPASQVQATGLDISKEAIQLASRYKSLDWLVGSNARLPLQADQFDLVLCLFGFPCYAEFARVLKADGLLLQLDPGPQHLLELRQIIYPELKAETNSDARQLEWGQHFELLAESQLHYSLLLDKASLLDLLAMTPHLFRASHAGKQQINQLSGLSLQVDLRLKLSRKPAIATAALKDAHVE